MPKTKLLVVDDEPKNLHALRRIMDLSAMEIVEAHSGHEALRQVLRNDFFLVLMDVQMPDMNGYEAASLILQNQKSAHLPIIFMTASSRDEHFILEGYDIGAVDYIQKPFDPLVLNSKVSVFRELWLQRRQLRRNNLQLEDLNKQLEDTSAELKRRNAELLHTSLHDPLTDLPNRRYFLLSLEKAVARARRNNKHLAVFFLDLDYFKEVNDALGHDAGDRLLVTVARRLLTSVRSADMVCRLGGDEFAVLTEGISDKQCVASIAQHMLDKVGLPTNLKGTTYTISPSIGIAIYPECGEDCEQIMQAADTAMYLAKTNGRNNYRFFSSGLNSLADEQIRLSEELTRAQLEGEFEVYYQPQFDTNNGAVVSVEALLRWNHPTDGVICADQFISVIERNGLIQTVGEWVLVSACHQFIQWSGQGLINSDAVTLDVNISSFQLHDKQLLKTIASTLNGSAISSHNLCLEFCESLVLERYNQCRDVMNKISKMGIALSIDDVGTALIPYAKLRHLPFNSLKIDRSVIARLESDSSARDWVKAIAYMGRSLGASVIAKGVEDERQQSILSSLGVNLSQGFHYARPMSADMFTGFLKERAVGDN